MGGIYNHDRMQLSVISSWNFDIICLFFIFYFLFRLLGIQDEKQKTKTENVEVNIWCTFWLVLNLSRLNVNSNTNSFRDDSFISNWPCGCRTISSRAFTLDLLTLVWHKKVGNCWGRNRSLWLGGILSLTAILLLGHVLVLIKKPVRRFTNDIISFTQFLCTSDVTH